MGNQINQLQNIELDIKDLFWKILSQWKSVLAAALLMSMLVSGMKLISDTKAYEEKLSNITYEAEQAKLPAEERIHAIFSTIPDEGQEAVKVVAEEKETLALLKNYVSESILMSTDPTNQRVIKMGFEISTDNNETLPILVKRYKAYIDSDSFAKLIKPVIAKNAKDEYIGELFYDKEDADYEIEYLEKDSVVRINLVIPEETNAEAVFDTIEEGLFAYCKELKKQYPHSINNVYSETHHIYHKNNVQKRTDTFNSIYNLENMIRTAEGTLSVEQKAAVDAIVRIRGEAKKNISKLGEEEVIDASMISKPELSKKYVVMGFILGAFMYMCIYALLILYRGTICSADNAERFTKSRLLGEMYYKDQTTVAGKIFNSDLVNKIRFRNKDNLDKQIDKAITAIVASCKHNNEKKISVFSINMDRDNNNTPAKIIKTIAKGVEEGGITVSIIDDPDGFDEMDLLETVGAVFAVGSNSKGKTLGKMISLCKDYGIRTIGCLFVSKV